MIRFSLLSMLELGLSKMVEVPGVNRPPPQGDGGAVEGLMMPNCKIEIMVLMKNVPEDKRLALMDHIEKNIKNYNEVLGCEVTVSALS